VSKMGKIWLKSEKLFVYGRGVNEISIYKDKTHFILHCNAYII